ncbi:MAG: hypothetical protein AB7T49_10265 [Oligoflexales bacterium]
MNYQIGLFWLGLSVAVVSASCKNRSNFSGPERVRKSPVGEEGTPETQEGNTSNPNTDGPGNPDSDSNGCNEAAGKTVAKLLTDYIKNDEPNQFVTYEISLTNCDGSPRTLTDESIYYDVNAFIREFGRDVRYRILDPSNNNELLEGILVHETGKDLFGNTGDNRGYWRTEKVTLNGVTEKLHLVINMSNLTLKPSSDSASGSTTSDAYIIDSFLRFGEASPVKEPLKVLR